MIYFSNGLHFKAECYVFLLRLRGGHDLWIRKPKWLMDWLMANDMIRPSSAR